MHIWKNNLQLKGGSNMSTNPRNLLNEFTGGLQELGTTHGEELNSFMNLLKTMYRPTAIDTKTKELISVAIAAYTRCQYCIAYHVYKALEAGAKRDEIVDASMIAVAFGAGPAMAYSVTLVKQSIDEFENDFKKI
jgi:AhpD family alkylhydroperoxidase